MILYSAHAKVCKYVHVHCTIHSNQNHQVIALKTKIDLFLYNPTTVQMSYKSKLLNADPLMMFSHAWLSIDIGGGAENLSTKWTYNMSTQLVLSPAQYLDPQCDVSNNSIISRKQQLINHFEDCIDFVWFIANSLVYTLQLDLEDPLASFSKLCIEYQPTIFHATVKNLSLKEDINHLYFCYVVKNRLGSLRNLFFYNQSFESKVQTKTECNFHIPPQQKCVAL